MSRRLRAIGRLVRGTITGAAARATTSTPNMQNVGIWGASRWDGCVWSPRLKPRGRWGYTKWGQSLWALAAKTTARWGLSQWGQSRWSEE